MKQRILKASILLIPLAYAVYRALQIPGYWAAAGLFAGMFLLFCALKEAKAVFWGSLGISFIFLDWTFEGIDASHVSRVIVQTKWHMMAGFVILVISCQVLRAWKWQILLGGIKKIKIGRLFSMIMIGFWGNSVFPGKSGEIIRVYLLGTKEGIPKTGVLATVVLDRMFDGLVTLMLFVTAFFLLKDTVASMQPAFYTSTVVYAGVVAGLFLTYYRLAWFNKILRILIGTWLPGLCSRLTALLESFHKGLEILRSGRQLAMVTVLSIVMWAVALVGYSLALASLDIHTLVPASFGSGLLVATVVLAVSINLAVSIPAAPGGAGPYHAFILFGLSLLNPLISTPGSFEHSLVAVFSVLLWVIQTGNVIILGLVCLYREKISVGMIRKEVRERKN